jgi:hypothetical protein
MADNLISAALAGQQGTPDAGTVGTEQTANEQAQPQVNYVTEEKLNAAMDELKRTIQSSTDKSYNRVQKMIANMKQAGVQNPTYEQASAMLAMQEEQSEPASNTERETARPQPESVGNPDVKEWIKKVGGDPTKNCWNDIYDAVQESGVEMITRDDPEYEKYFSENGKPKVFLKERHFVRAFEQALAEKKQRLSQSGEEEKSTPASSPALGSGGVKSSFIPFKDTSPNQLITAGLKQ